MTPYMNHGRWVMDCPSPECGAALKVLSWQALAVCDCRDRDFCQHGMMCGTLIQLNWPPERIKIEAAVSSRRVVNRNWHPWEPLDLLIEENVAHGLDRS